MSGHNVNALSRLITRCLDARGETQADLCRRIGMSEGWLSGLINEQKKQLPISSIVKLADGLGVHPAVVAIAYLEAAGHGTPQDVHVMDGPEVVYVTDKMRRLGPAAAGRISQVVRAMTEGDGVFPDDEKS